jgi:predicted RNase H-like HicB family nuclease
MKYAVVFEKGEDGGYGAYVPDLPGCFATASSKPAIETLIAEAITFHIEGLQIHGHPVPMPVSEVDYIEPMPVSEDPVEASVPQPLKAEPDHVTN